MDEVDPHLDFRRFKLCTNGLLTIIVYDTLAASQKKLLGFQRILLVG